MFIVVDGWGFWVGLGVGGRLDWLANCTCHAHGEPRPPTFSKKPAGQCICVCVCVVKLSFVCLPTWKTLGFVKFMQMSFRQLAIYVCTSHSIYVCVCVYMGCGHLWPIWDTNHAVNVYCGPPAAFDLAKTPTRKWAKSLGGWLKWGSALRSMCQLYYISVCISPQAHLHDPQQGCTGNKLGRVNICQLWNHSMSLVFIKITINAYCAGKEYSFYKPRQIFKRFQFLLSFLIFN